MIRHRWELGPGDLVYVRFAQSGMFASGVRSAEHGVHNWPTATHQPRVIMQWEDPATPDNRVVALVFEDGINKGNL
jgi:hypothetical protein